MNKYPGIIQCLACLKILVSFHRHDFKCCGCKQGTFIDGGHDYLRYGGQDLDLIKLLKIIAMPKAKNNEKRKKTKK